jgi:GABA(A) receptor-associated protein
MYTYQKTHSLTDRLAESKRIRTKYPDRIPVIMEKHQSSTIPTLSQTKFLVPSNLVVSQLLYVIRKRIKLNPNEALFIFVNDTLPSSSMDVMSLYNTQAQPDGFLYITYSNENTFG